MKKGFRLHIRDFGKIESANIDVAPVTFFVGDNNSGKSYLTALLYTLLNLRLFHSGFNLCTNSEEYRWCETWLEQSLSPEMDGKQLITLDIETQDRFQTLLNLILKENRSQLVQMTFNSEVSIGEIYIEFLKQEELCIFTEKKQFPNDTKYSYSIFLKSRRFYRTTLISKSFNNTFVICYILEILLKSNLLDNYMSPACFLPTSRTGFLLTYKSLLRSTIEDAYDISNLKTPRTELTRPCTDFLKNLASISQENEDDRFQSLIDFIETKMLSGHISISNELPQSLIRYRPDGSDQELPMHLTSGVVTELTPLLLMLQYHSNMSALFIEEPEMSLHPGLQLEIARVLLRLHSSGLLVFVTTHSDTILQHVNNMLKLGALDDVQQNKIMEELGYTRDDLISADEIEMYQFDVNPATQKTTIQKLEKGPYGFIVPSFNNALRHLLNISRRMEMDDDV